MKKWAKGLSCAMAICLLTSGIGLAAAEGASSTGTRMPNGYMSGLKDGSVNGMAGRPEERPEKRRNQRSEERLGERSGGRPEGRR